MASHGGKDEPEWVKRVKEGGSVSLRDPNDCSNGWASPPGDKFMVRGPDYFSTKVKIPAGDYLLKPLGFDWIRGSTKIGDALGYPNNRVIKALNEEFPDGDKPFIWAFNLQLPSKENYSAIAYFTCTDPIPEGTLMHQFVNGDDNYRNSRLKLIANIVKGPWIVKKAVGEQAICVIGRALTCKFSVAEKFLEVDIDIGSSVVASAIVHLAFGYITSLTVDLAFLIEGQTESELPEQILGAFRFSELNPASAELFEMSCEASTGNLPSSLGTRLWKSLGQGFSHLLQSNPDLQSSNPDHQSCNQDLQLSNQDLQSSNPDLYSSNQDLHSSNQHLCSSNQDLCSSNQDLQLSNQDLHSSNQDLQSSNQHLCSSNQDFHSSNPGGGSVCHANSSSDDEDDFKDATSW